jgi:hypothetical protein
MRKMLIVALLLAWGTPATAAVIHQDFTIDLDDLSYGIQDDGVTRTAYMYVPVADPFVFAAVGDQLITTVRFAGNQRLRMIDGLGASEAVQLQYFGSGSQGTRSTQLLELLGVTGNYTGLPAYELEQTFTCGNCLIGFTLGSDLTSSQFSFRGVRMTTTVDSLVAGAPYQQFFFLATAADFAVRPVPEPATTALLLAGLAGIAVTRRRSVRRSAA